MPIGDRWRLVESLLSSIHKETLVFSSPVAHGNVLPDLHPWTQSLIGVIQLGTEDLTESYVDYLEDKYH
ncbi:MAG: hypothetical protein EA366_02110 [Spirulina sp. DLM2.Bin59]|nr:MAG: hypothetical protein EA366_02110 [Spirulina sp. DLM2.Bin59]